MSYFKEIVGQVDPGFENSTFKDYQIRLILLVQNDPDKAVKLINTYRQMGRFMCVMDDNTDLMAVMNKSQDSAEISNTLLNTLADHFPDLLMKIKNRLV